MSQKCHIKKMLPVFIVCLFVFNLTLSARAATLVWSGEGADDLASNPVNWTGRVLPQMGSGVVFDSTSSKNCTWDLSITLSSFNINPGYDGTVTINAGLAIDNGFTWIGEGGNNLASNPANWSGGTAPRNGDDIDFEGTEDCLWDLDISPASLRMGIEFKSTVTLFKDLSISGDLSIEGGVLNSNSKTLSADGDLLIGLNGTLYATSSIIQVNGDWINRGAFISGTSTVFLIGIHQTVYGDNTFYTLIKTSDSANTLYFEAGRTQTILNNLTLKGTAGNLLLLRSTVNETSWSIAPGSTRYISCVDIKDMNNVSHIGIETDYSNNSGNNSNVYFDIDQCLQY